MLNNLKPTHTSNSRLLYKETWGRALNWQGLGFEVDSFIDISPQLHHENSALYLYFFDFPDQEGFYDLDVWVGREVTGFLDLEENDEFHFCDLDGGALYQGQIELDPSLMLSFADLFSQITQELNQGDLRSKVAPSWRLKVYLNGEFSRVFTEFFVV